MDWLQKKTAAVGGMSDEERNLQLKKIDILEYVAYLLEVNAYLNAPGKEELVQFQTRIRRNFDARNVSKTA